MRTCTGEVPQCTTSYIMIGQEVERKENNKTGTAERNRGKRAQTDQI
jgi:hypothetical protein